MQGVGTKLGTAAGAVEQVKAVESDGVAHQMAVAHHSDTPLPHGITSVP